MSINKRTFFDHTWSSKSSLIILPQFRGKIVLGIFKLTSRLNDCPTICCAKCPYWFTLDVNCFHRVQSVSDGKIVKIVTTVIQFFIYMKGKFKMCSNKPIFIDSSLKPVFFGPLIHLHCYC
jgi:hypothetical protein